MGRGKLLIGECQKKEFYLTDTDFDDFACDSTVKIMLD